MKSPIIYLFLSLLLTTPLAMAKKCPSGQKFKKYKIRKRTYSGCFNKNKKQGLHKSLFRNKTTRHLVNFKDGIKHGPERRYFKSGQLKLDAQWNQGVKTGTWKTYKKDGSLKSTKQQGPSQKPSHSSSQWLTVQLAGIALLQENGNTLFSGKLAWVPTVYTLGRQLGFRVHLGAMALVSASEEIFFAPDMSLGFMYHPGFLKAIAIEFRMGGQIWQEGDLYPLLGLGLHWLKPYPSWSWLDKVSFEYATVSVTNNPTNQFTGSFELSF